ncbi:serine O-acetyltransferase [Sphingomonas kyeonggiensis]|uniref:Serine O-acetyltransferase n=1 Tax=Sphingomonas kyeonggiensis TaxID=1268553 RepID=A0A7W6JWQ9_9SPHN|nr:hypothetical protein [Sphingomonas kyeonggiensis]MBB4099932.1 serine O-acetyltransferase [Sphingomonas kyeonggiensis]
MTIALRIGDADRLSAYVARQLLIFGGEDEDREGVDAFVPEALERFRPISRVVRIFENDRFDHLHSLQYATFLYLLGRVAWEADRSAALVDKLFFLNKSLCNIEVHPAVKLPPVFFVSHGIGAVLGNADYGDRLVIFQNVTVGRVGDNRPRLGRDVILYAGASVTGSAVIGDNVVIGAGVRVHNSHVPDNSLVRERNGEINITPLVRDYNQLYLND